MSALHLSPATAFFFVDCCQFGPSWIFGLKMELMVCDGLVGGTTEQSCLFHELILYYQLYEFFLNFLHHTSAVPQPFVLLIAANLPLARFLGRIQSLWPVLDWLAEQRSKDVFFLSL